MTLQREVLDHCRECGAPRTAQDRAAVTTAIIAGLGLRDPQQWRAVRELVGLASLYAALQQTPRRTP